MNSQTLERLTFLNTGILVLLVWKVFVASDAPVQPSVESASILSTQPTAPLSRPNQVLPKDLPPASGGAQNYEELLLQTIEPLERAFAEHGEDIDLPTDEEFDAAIDTNRLDSEASQKVLTILQSGYERFNMPFPKLEIPTSRVSTMKTPQRNNAPENSVPPPFSEWLRRSTDTLLAELKTKKESSAGLVPTEQQLQSAIESDSPISEESRLVIDMLKNGYARLKIDFPEYGQSPESTEDSQTDKNEGSTSNSLQQQVSQQRIIKAYFEGQVQRLKLEAVGQSKVVDDKLPSDTQIETAVNSSSLKTDESKVVIAKIKECYEYLGLTFYSPPSGE